MERLQLLQIGPHIIHSPLVLAPMAGVADLPFRRLCRRFGAGMAATEMLTADTSKWGTQKSRFRLPVLDEAEPRVVQIAGAEPAQLAEAARRSADLGAQIIDINMGCPAKKVCKRAAGSALLRDEALVDAILRAVVKAVDIPVTLKSVPPGTPKLATLALSPAWQKMLAYRPWPYTGARGLVRLKVRPSTTPLPKWSTRWLFRSSPMAISARRNRLKPSCSTPVQRR